MEGIDEYGTNTFQIHTWMICAPTTDTGVANLDPPSTYTPAARESEHGEDYETDTELRGFATRRSRQWTQRCEVE